MEGCDSRAWMVFAGDSRGSNLADDRYGRRKVTPRDLCRSQHRRDSTKHRSLSLEARRAKKRKEQPGLSDTSVGRRSRLSALWRSWNRVEHSVRRNRLEDPTRIRQRATRHWWISGAL